MATTEKVEHEGIVKSISTQTLEITINSHSACTGCHAKGACSISDVKQKIITVERTGEEFQIGEKVIVYASLNNAFYSVILAYFLPSIVIISTIFYLENSGLSELTAAVGSIGILVIYFFILYLCREKISKKIKFSVTKIKNY